MNKKAIILICILSLLSLCKSQENMNELKEHVDSICQEPEHKHFNKTTLGYITPWNLNGLELALKYSAKFDIISPTWFEIKHEIFQGKFHSKIEGANYINSNFMQELRERNPKIKILPRFKCEGFTRTDYEEWLKNEKADQFIRVIIRRLK